MYNISYSIRDRQSEFIRDGRLEWSNAGCIYDCNDCMYTHKRSYMIRGLEIYDNCDDMRKELQALSPNDEIEIAGNPLAHPDFFWVISHTINNTDASVSICTRYMHEDASEYLDDRVSVIYNYNAMVPIAYALRCCREIINAGCSLMLSIRPVCHINPHLGITEDYEIDSLSVMSDMALRCSIPMSADRFQIRKEDAGCVDRVMIDNMHDIGGGMLGLKKDDDMIERIKSEITGEKKWVAETSTLYSQ